MRPDDALRALDLTVAAAADMLAVYRTGDVEAEKRCWSRLRQVLDMMENQEK
jgi:uncharacterized protein